MITKSQQKIFVDIRILKTIIIGSTAYKRSVGKTRNGSVVEI